MAMPKCPRCGEREMAFDWVGTTSVAVKGDEVRSVTRGGVTGAPPDRTVCFGCGDERPFNPDDEYMSKAVNDMLADLPLWLQDKLADGDEVYHLG